MYQREDNDPSLPTGKESLNDRALNRDLLMLCKKVAQDPLYLPDGRRLIFRVQGTGILDLDAQELEVA